MSLLEKAISSLKYAKESSASYIKVSFADIQSDLCNKASRLLNFEDGSGELRIYEGDSLYVDWSGLGWDAFGAGATAFIPVVGPFLSGAIIAGRGLNITQEIQRNNTYIFVLDSSNRCVFAIGLHCQKSKHHLVQSLLKRLETNLKRYQEEDRLQRELDQLSEEYEAVSDQLSATLNPSDRMKLEQQLEQLETRMEAIETELNR